MNRRCIVNVATGEFYIGLQDKLKLSFQNCKGDFDLMLWADQLPPGSRPHSESPYGFKVHAIKAAYERGYTSILWLDSPAYAVKEDVSPIFEKIEKEGYYAMSHIDPLGDYVTDHVLSQFRMMERDDLKGKNLPSGSCYGFDFLSYEGKTLFDRLYGCERNGHFKHMAPHRHDETILALILVGAEKPIFTFDPLFQSDSPECVIKSGERK